MATINGFTRERMLDIENTTVTSGRVENNRLYLTTREGEDIDAGNLEVSSSEAQIFEFTTPSTQWLCPHALGTMFPDYTVYVNGEVVLAGFTPVDPNNGIVTFYNPTAGSVRISK